MAKVHGGFTLIELSVVLVIVGLIAGGVLVGRDLINTSTVRAQISQIASFNAAVNAFHGKYNGLPGDLFITYARQFGLPAGAGCDGSTANRDGNGLLDGWPPAAPPNDFHLAQGQCETAIFWEDLGNSGLIEGAFAGGVVPTFSCQGQGGAGAATLTGGNMASFFPTAKIGNNNFLYVYEENGYNWFGLANITNVYFDGTMSTNATIPVIQAYNMDKKIDDGIPVSGKVQAIYINSSLPNFWGLNPVNAQTSDSTTSCYNSTTNAYSISVSGGANPNCALSFQFQ